MNWASIIAGAIGGFIGGFAVALWNSELFKRKAK